MINPKLTVSLSNSFAIKLSYFTGIQLKIVDKEYIVDETEKIFRLKFTEPREGIYKIIR